MTDAAFNGSYQLLYFLEVVPDMTDNIFYQLFLSLEIWGYLGPLALVVIGYVLAKKDRSLGVIAFVVQCLFAAQYFALLEATPAYWWHVIIILLGGILACVVPLMDR